MDYNDMLENLNAAMLAALTNHRFRSVAKLATAAHRLEGAMVAFIQAESAAAALLGEETKEAATDRL